MQKEIKINIKDFEKNKTIKEITTHLNAVSNKFNVVYGIENK